MKEEKLKVVNDFLSNLAEQMKDKGNDDLYVAIAMFISKLTDMIDEEYRRGYDNGVDITFSEFKIWLNNRKV